MLNGKAQDKIVIINKDTGKSLLRIYTGSAAIYLLN